jgi:tagatose-1,6-bisphosphate aldolase non-catalytic subunit AgaZ/GatZ
LLLILWEQERYEECTPVIEELLHPTQARLCKPLRNALTAVLDTQRQDWASYARALESALRLARGWGYL